MIAHRADAAGNRFLVIEVEATGGEPPAAFWQRPEGAGAFAVDVLGDEQALDGVLVLSAPSGAGLDEGARARMTVWNRDGSRAAACGNGLRAIAALVLRRVSAAAVDPVADPRAATDGPVEALVETDAGVRGTTIARAELAHLGVAASRASISVEIGPCRLLPPRRVEVAGEALVYHFADVGNPHAIVFVSPDGKGVVRPSATWRRRLAAAGGDLFADAEVSACIAAQGAAMQRVIPGGVNVSFCAFTPTGLSARVYERGVGETRACGTGATAAAAVVDALRSRTLPCTVRQPGGELRISRQAGALWLNGPTELERLDPEATARVERVLRTHAAGGEGRPEADGGPRMVY